VTIFFILKKIKTMNLKPKPDTLLENVAPDDKSNFNKTRIMRECYQQKLETGAVFESNPFDLFENKDTYFGENMKIEPQPDSYVREIKNGIASDFFTDKNDITDFDNVRNELKAFDLFETKDTCFEENIEIEPQPDSYDRDLQSETASDFFKDVNENTYSDNVKNELKPDAEFGNIKLKGHDSSKANVYYVEGTIKNELGTNSFFKNEIDFDRTDMKYGRILKNNVREEKQSDLSSFIQGNTYIEDVKREPVAELCSSTALDFSNIEDMVISLDETLKTELETKAWFKSEHDFDNTDMKYCRMFDSKIESVEEVLLNHIEHPYCTTFQKNIYKDNSFTTKKLTTEQSKPSILEEQTNQIHADISESPRTSEQVTSYQVDRQNIEGSKSSTPWPILKSILIETSTASSIKSSDFRPKVIAPKTSTSPSIKSSNFRPIAPKTSTSSSTKSSNFRPIAPALKLYTCGLCPATFTCENQLKTHISSHSIKSILKCHINKNHNSQMPREQTYLCKICSATFQTESLLNIHMGTHAIFNAAYVRVNPFECKVCRASFGDSVALKMHMFNHNKYKCRFCSMSYIYEDSLKHHINKNHYSKMQSEQPYRCKICLACFKTESLLDIHLGIHHAPNAAYITVKQFKCKVCKASFGDKIAFNMHMLTHKRERPYKCHVCLASFVQEDILRSHIRYCHKVNEPYSCEVCSYSFSRRHYLLRHMQIHTREKRLPTGEKQLECGVCSAPFSRRQNLQRHMHVHTGEKQFKCGVCSASFSRRQNLHRHMNVHTGEKRYKCGVCEAKFFDSTGLLMHIKIHSGERKFKCGVCEALFSDSINLDVHMKTHVKIH